MKKLLNDDIKNLLKYDYINRNTQLSVFIRFINSIEDSRIIAVDGAWGSGKTVFVQQLRLLCEGEDSEAAFVKNIDEADIQQLKDTYIPIYYNAWENDYFDDPLQSVLYNLIAKIDKTSGSMMENARKRALAKIDIAGLIKNVSHDGLNFSAETSDEKLTKEIQLYIERNEKVRLMLHDLIESTGKRILFIIDELDRCSPAFAVKLLEVVKHYFEIDKVTFVAAVNIEQLSYTVKKFYGNDFDGHGYLDKFFDFNTSLNEPDVTKFAEQYLKRFRSDSWHEIMPIEIAKYYKMSMREAENYFDAIDLIENYMKNVGSFRNSNIEYLSFWLFVPLALALKIRSVKEYKDFINGKGGMLVEGVVNASSRTQRLVQSVSRDSSGNAVKNATVAAIASQAYIGLFNENDNREVLDSFHEAIRLIGYYTTIKSVDSEKNR